MSRMVIFKDPKNRNRPVLATGNRSRIKLLPSLKHGSDDEVWRRCNKICTLYNLGRRLEDEKILAAILGGLRLLQSSGVLPQEIMDILTTNNSHDPLNDDEIDGLCELLNGGG